LTAAPFLLEGAMSTIEHDQGSSGRPPPVTNRAHPRVYTILIALTLWFIFAVWAFSGPGLSNYLLFIVSGFLCVALGLPLILFRVGRARGTAQQSTAQQSDDQPPLRDWVRWDYDTQTGRLAGSSAATQILLPIAAAAVGMTAIAIVYLVTAG
jgi:hypothetical protein